VGDQCIAYQKRKAEDLRVGARYVKKKTRKVVFFRKRGGSVGEK